jgi:tetratricopeptide (TPR) repeat protein
MHCGRFSEADQLLEAMVSGHDDRLPERGGALWWLTIERRTEGRLREAERVARRIIALWPANFEAYEAYGQILTEEAHYREAARIFDSLAAHPAFPPEMPTRVARQRAWYLAHLVTALAASGDTARLAVLADTLERLGKQSAYGRDRLLHHYARGLLYRARHDDDDAIRELRLAIYSPTVGYTRINYELGRLLLARGRAMEAVQEVRPALFGSLESSNGYITRTELHELMAEAFDALHQSDSAAAHYRWVVDAWRGADAPFMRRFQIARSRLSQLERKSSPGR